jgi:hypothetical protein
VKLGTSIYACVAAALFASPAFAALSVSAQPTKNVTCSAGVCKATAKRAVLNSTDLDNLLEAGDVTLQSGPKAQDIDILAVVSWANAHELTLDSYRGIKVAKHIDVGNFSNAGLAVTTNDGGSGGVFYIAPRAKVDIESMGASLVIDGTAYQVVLDVPTLIVDVAANPTGHFALGVDYDAEGDGTYQGDVITEFFTGTLEGLGHRISRLDIDGRSVSGAHVGFFYGVGGGPISNLHLISEKVRAGHNTGVGGLAGICVTEVFNVEVTANVSGQAGSQVGGLCGVADAPIIGAHVSGTVSGIGAVSGEGEVGGLVGLGQGTIQTSSSAANVSTGKGWTAGGLAGSSVNAIQFSFATGSVVAGNNAVVGGLVGSSTGSYAQVEDCYATGSAFGGMGSRVGGLIGFNDSPVGASYASGAVASGSGNAVGGLIGDDEGPNDLVDTYWDTDTSGQSHGVGNNTGYPGVTGLTTAQFQAGLPTGFATSIWAEGPGINGGLPYLLANPE